MNNLFFLTEDDFYIDQGQKGPILACNYEGFCMVLFHADAGRCKHCEETIPEFKKIASKFGQCGFGLCNLNKFPGVVTMSKQTIAPFKYVPYIVFYVNGRPFARYEGERNASDMAEFLKEIITLLQPKRSFIEQKKFKVEGDATPVFPGGGIPYNLICDEDKGVCYLTNSEVLGKRK